MEHQLEEIRDQQKASWNKFSGGWKKWDDKMMDFMKPMSNEIIRLLELKDNDTVLDVASGTGEPGLTIAAMLNGGKVVITDLAEEMLKVAQEKATQRGIKNIETCVCDVSALPFDDETFDAISCRLGFMFFPDMNLAVKEMARVLKPGGRLAATVWNVAEKNFWVTAMGGTINKNMQIPPPPPGAPGMFRCANPGLVQEMFRQAGLKNAFEKEVNGLLKCENTDTYWNMMTDVAAPFVAALSKANDAMKDKIKREVFEMVDEKYPNGNININSSALIIYGEK